MDRLRRLGIGLALIGAPVIAAETALAPAIEQAPPGPAVTMGFERAEDNFPGSAFYYLEDTPAMTGTAAPIASPGSQVQMASNAVPSLGPAAAALFSRGSGQDMMRAQECLTKAIYYEAASESDAGQRAVAQVVLNRVTHPAWPSTVCGVVYQGSARRTGCQFTFTCDGSLARVPSTSGWARASRIARSALAGSVYAPVGLATHYHTLAVSPYWAPSLTRLTVIGAHIFYRLPGSNGGPGAFAVNYVGNEPAPGQGSAVRSSGPDPVTIAATPIPGVPDLPPAAATIAGPAPVAASNNALPAPAPTPNNLPRAGRVREEYRNAGRWIERD